jgi:hypothetical protein
MLKGLNDNTEIMNLFDLYKDAYKTASGGMNNEPITSDLCFHLSDGFKINHSYPEWGNKTLKYLGLNRFS